jgi:hypothetical protein
VESKIKLKTRPNISHRVCEKLRQFDADFLLSDRFGVAKTMTVFAILTSSALQKP